MNNLENIEEINQQSLKMTNDVFIDKTKLGIFGVISRFLCDFKKEINWIWVGGYFIMLNLCTIGQPLMSFVGINLFLFGVIILAYMSNKIKGPNPW